MTPLIIVIVAVFSYLIGKHGERCYRDIDILDANFRNRRLIEQNAKLRRFIHQESFPENQHQFRTRIKLEGKRPI